MTRKEEIEYIKWLPLEERAKKAPKELSCLISLIVLLPGLVAGLCYWFVSDFISPLEDSILISSKVS